MLPHYHHLQLVVMDKYHDHYYRDDVVAIRSDELHALLVKRIVGIPGDEVVIRDRDLYINGSRYEFYAEDAFQFAGILSTPVFLREEQYIVIGDNVAESRDSRYAEIGIICGDQIQGRLLW